MIDVVSSVRKTISAPDFYFDSTLTSVAGLSCLPQEDEESLALIAPFPEDGSYHSDVASMNSQPNLLSRVSKLPQRFAPHGLSDEDIINACGSRSLHDIADIDNVSKNVVNNLIDMCDSASAVGQQAGSPSESPQGSNSVDNSSSGSSAD